MVFSDDDLNKLKEWSTECGWTSYEGKRPCWHQEVKDILARLSAAEGVCQQAEIHITPKTPMMFRMKELLEAWRKSKGE